MRHALLLSLLLAVLAACAGPQRLPPPVPGLAERNDLWRIHFVDIGQGLATLLEFPCGAALVDAGGEKDARFDSDKALVAYLDAFFDRRPDLDRTLDLLLLTHPHVDHTRGVAAVLERYRVRHVVDNGMTQGSGAEGQKALQAFATAAEGVRRFVVERDAVTEPAGLTNDVIDPIRCPGVDPSLRVLWGHVGQDPGWPGIRFGRTPYQNANNHSVVLRVDFGRASGLFTGDLEEPAIRDLLTRSAGTDVLDVDVYQVGHHGSINGTLPELVAAMSPQIAVFSMGPPHWQEQWSAWKYGHPRREIVAMLEDGITRRRKPIDVQVGIQGTVFEPRRVDKALYATGWDGHVVIEAMADGRMRVLTSGR